MAKARLSMVFQDARGSMGKQVLALTPQGLVVRSKPRYRYPKNADVQAQQERMRLAAAAWRELTDEQIEAWGLYGQTVSRTDAVTGRQYTLPAKSAFMGLSVKFIQANPGAEIPALPPESDFYEEGVVVTAAELPGLGVRFTASGPNTPGVATELMVQKLKNRRWSPTKFYKSAAFHSFEPGSLTFDLPLEPGAYAFAYRFIRLATGQTDLQQEIGKVTIDDLVSVEERGSA